MTLSRPKCGHPHIGLDSYTSSICNTCNHDFGNNPGDTYLDAIDFFIGFANEALIAVCALMIAGEGILRTGALEPVGRVLARLWKVNPSMSLLLTLLLGAFISAFINNVPVVVLLLPVLIFADRYGLITLALHRTGKRLKKVHDEISDSCGVCCHSSCHCCICRCWQDTKAAGNLRWFSQTP